MYTKPIHIDQGSIIGRSFAKYNLYAGIPYAQAPVGNLRFKQAMPLKSSDKTFYADHFSSKFPQTPNAGFYKKEFYSNSNFFVPTSENSLNLNIWTPRDITKNSNYPVAVWIHGGGFDHGYNSEMEFDGAAYAERGIVLVTLNYRLGILGFLAHPLLSAENPKHISGNYGIYDQIAGLKWIKQNIAAFGGNPDQITLMGQSAGAISVQTLASSPLTKGLFSAAIMQSGGSYKTGLKYDLSLTEAENIGEEIFEPIHPTSADDLRKIPADQLLNIYSKYQSKYFKDGVDFTHLSSTSPILLMAPNIDGQLLTQGYDKTIEEHKLHNIPYLLGSNKNDLDVDPHHLKDNGLYKGSQAFAQYESNLNNPTYLYYFEHDLPGDNAGAFHSAELWYMFNTLNRSWRPMKESDQKLSIEMVDNWASFIKTHKPLADWTKYTNNEPFIKIFK